MLWSEDPLAIRPDPSSSWRRQSSLLLCPRRVYSISNGEDGSFNDGRLKIQKEKNKIQNSKLHGKYRPYLDSVVPASAGQTAIGQQDECIYRTSMPPQDSHTASAVQIPYLNIFIPRCGGYPAVGEVHNCHNSAGVPLQDQGGLPDNFQLQLIFFI